MSRMKLTRGERTVVFASLAAGVSTGFFAWNADFGAILVLLLANAFFPIIAFAFISSKSVIPIFSCAVFSFASSTTNATCAAVWNYSHTSGGTLLRDEAAMAATVTMVCVVISTVSCLACWFLHKALPAGKADGTKKSEN